MMGHACPMLGLSVGVPDRQPFPPAGPFEEHYVDKHRRRIPPIATFTAITYLYGAADTRRPAPVIPVLTTIPARPHPGTHAAVKAIGYVPGSPVHTDTRMSASGRLAPPAAGARACPRVRAGMCTWLR